MHKGTKLGPRDYWNTKINYHQREAFNEFKKLQVMKETHELKKRLFQLHPADKNLQNEISKLEERIKMYERSYKINLGQFMGWTIRAKYGRKNLAHIAPYLEKYGEKAGFIYIFRTLDEQPIYKIGKTRSLKSRTTTHNIDQPFEYVMIEHTEECDLVEKMLHSLLDSQRLTDTAKREWYNLSDEHIERIKQFFKWSISNKK